MTRYSLLLIFLLSSFMAFSQTFEKSDPKAKKVLDKLKSDYEGLKSCQMDFQIVIEVPQEPEEIQTGQLQQQGENFKVEMEDQAIYSNGDAIWVHLKSNNEVQINDPDFEEDNLMSPKQIMKLYENDEYIYALTFDGKKSGRKIQEIEFKPVDEDSDYSKLRMTIDKGSGNLKEMKVFSKDGSRFTMKIDNMLSNIKLDPGIFTFDSSKFPGIHVEDLRID